MIHPVPDSKLRRRLLRIVVLQRRLVRALCAQPEGSSVDQIWLGSVWKGVDQNWIRRFWENDDRQRATWIDRIAAAKPTDKQAILEIAKEQYRFRELWTAAPSVKMQKVNWRQDPFAAVKALLKCFYNPLFYQRHGFMLGNDHFHKEVFLDGFPSSGKKICPYCDNSLQKIELDHFLPKDHFPFLSCHPDNLIPSCHDSNSGKGTTVPLDWNQTDQAADWFHPRWRSGHKRLNIKVTETAERKLTIQLSTTNPADSIRVSNLDNTFRISKFWSRQIEDELQLIGSQVSDQFREEGIEPTEETVRNKLQTLAQQKKNEIGKRGLAMCHRALYAFAANTPAIVSDIVRSCKESSQF